MYVPIKGIATDILYNTQTHLSEVHDNMLDTQFVDNLRRHKLLLMTALHYGVNQDILEIRELQDRSAKTHKLAKEFGESYSDWPCVIVKGCSTASMYTHPHGRVVGDIDILTTKNVAVEFYNHLRKSGCTCVLPHGNEKEPYSGEREYLIDKLLHFHEMPPLLTPGGLYVDLNFRAAYRGSKSYRNAFTIDAIEIYFESILKPVPNMAMHFANPLHDLLYLCVHYACEIYLFCLEGSPPGTPDIRLFKILDVAMFLKSISSELSEFLEVIKQASAEKPCAFIFAVLVDLFDLKEAEQLLAELKIDMTKLSNSYLSLDGSVQNWPAAPSQRIEHDFLG